MRKTFLFLILNFLTISLLTAEEKNLAVAGRIGTLGLGIEMFGNFHPKINARLGINKYTWDYDTEESDVEYDVELNLDSYEVLVDFYPFGDTFHLTGGFLNNKNELNLDANIKEGETVEIGDREYTRAQAGTLKGKVDFDSFAPYIGLGWGNPLLGGRVHVIFDIGIVMQNEPSVSLSSTNGLLSQNQTFKNELLKEENELEDDLSDFKYYLVLSLGVTVNF